jgi:hypothetical protein
MPFPHLPPTPTAATQAPEVEQDSVGLQTPDAEAHPVRTATPSAQEPGQQSAPQFVRLQTPLAHSVAIVHELPAGSVPVKA